MLRLRAAEPRSAGTQWPCPRTTCRNPACLSGTVELAWTGAYLRRLPQHDYCLAQKGAVKLPPLSTTLLTPDPKDATAADLELDEVWSFVGSKRNPVYVWIALCRATRQAIASSHTAHIERWNNTLRQRLGRFVRKTLSFSKCSVTHWICLQFFLHRYNLEIAIRRG
jgi:insertion element IS1 protein InsB